MGRVSLTESYDDRSVIAKLNVMDRRVKENTTVVTAAEASAKASAQAAQETADRFAGSVGAVVQNANAQINASKAQVDQAKAEVDETVTTVAQAVQTANDASASAQQSATTVEGYDTRLTAVENADTQNVKLTGAQTITGEKTFSSIYIPTTNGNYNGGAVIKVPNNLGTTDIITSKNDNSASILNLRLIKDDTSTALMTMIRTPSNQQKYMKFQVNDDGTYVLRGPSPYSGAPSDSYTTKAYVESTDGETNNLVHRTSAETINGQKTFVETIIGIANKKILENSGSIAANKYLVWKFPKAKIEAFRGRAVFLFLGRTRLTMALGSLYYHSNDNDISFGGVTLLPGGNNAEFTVSSDDTYMYICQKGTGNAGQDAFKVAIVWAIDFALKIDYNPDVDVPVLMDSIPGTTHGSMVIE